MYVEIGSLESENFQRILDLMKSTPMKNTCISEIFNKMEYRNYLRKYNSGKLQNVYLVLIELASAGL